MRILSNDMNNMEVKRTEARKILLNRSDVTSFSTVPSFIIDAFFGPCDYKKRMLCCTFGFLNGVDADQLLTIVRWTDTKKEDVGKVKALYLDFEKPEYRSKYYSYNIHFRRVMFLNGDLRKNGTRVPKTQIQESDLYL